MKDDKEEGRIQLVNEETTQVSVDVFRLSGVRLIRV